MGAGTSKQGLTDKQIQKLVKETGFAPSELEFLNRRFRGLCKRGTTLSRADVMDNPHLKANPYVNRLYGVIQKDEFGEVTFDTFVHTAAVFRPGKDVNGKLQFIFNLFDYNMDDTLEAHELSDMIKTVRPDIGEEENVRAPPHSLFRCVQAMTLWLVCLSRSRLLPYTSFMLRLLRG